jgi:hypothetical protein
MKFNVVAMADSMGREISNQTADIDTLTYSVDKANARLKNNTVKAAKLM